MSLTGNPAATRNFFLAPLGKLAPSDAAKLDAGISPHRIIFSGRANFPLTTLHALTTARARRGSGRFRGGWTSRASA